MAAKGEGRALTRLEKRAYRMGVLYGLELGAQHAAQQLDRLRVSIAAKGAELETPAFWQPDNEPRPTPYHRGAR